jgi:glyoxylase-like metal-dependent hydrolase (beta-lactamase superfamily II)
MQLGNRHFNYFVIGQEEAAIIEGGVTGGVISLNRQWLQLQRKPAIRYLIASHAHFDHVCGIPALQELFPEASVLASAEAQKVLGKPKIVHNFFAQDEKMSAVLAAEGILEEIPLSPQPDSIGVDQVIGEGGEIQLRGGLKLRVIDAPGHSPCSLAFYLPQEQVMFVSDSGGFQISDDSLFPIFFQGYELYQETLKRLRGFPTRVLAIPHEKIWIQGEVQAFYDRAMKTAQDAYAAIERMLNSGLDEEAIKRDLFSYYYRGNLRIYTAENITTCVDLLVRRVKECLR